MPLTILGGIGAFLLVGVAIAALYGEWKRQADNESEEGEAERFWDEQW